MLLAHLKNTASNAWRGDYRLIGILSSISTSFRLLYGIIMILFYSMPRTLKLDGVRVLTRLFALFYGLDLITIALQVIARCVYLNLEASYKYELREFRPLKIDSSCKCSNSDSTANGYQSVEKVKSNQIHPIAIDEKDSGQLSKRKILAKNPDPE